jgi:hypothetical protein
MSIWTVVGGRKLLQVSVMETSKQVLGKEYPDTLISMGNLALTYQNQGRCKEAEVLEVSVTEMACSLPWNKSLPSTTLDTSSTPTAMSPTYLNTIQTACPVLAGVFPTFFQCPCLTLLASSHLSEQLNLSCDEGKKWIMSLIRETHMGANAKIDFKKVTKVCVLLLSSIFC